MTEEKKAFWSSLPGVLSGIAAIIGASATLYIAVIKTDTGKTAAEPTRDVSVPAEPTQRAPASGMTDAAFDAPAEPSQTVALVQASNGTTTDRAAPATALTDRLLGIRYSESQGPTQTGSFFFTAPPNIFATAAPQR